MSLSLGVWDVFAYAVPGSLYLTFAAFIAARLGWVAIGPVLHTPTLLLAGGIAVSSYVLGLVTYPLGAVADRWLPGASRAAQARAEFAERTPAARDRAFLQADMALLRAAVEIHDKDSSLEISRLGAVRIMIRNCSVPLAAASIACACTAIAGGNRILSVTSSLTMAAAAAAAIWQTRRFRHWWYMKTLETCYWIPAIDQAIKDTTRPPSRASNGQPARRPDLPPHRPHPAPKASPADPGRHCAVVIAYLSAGCVDRGWAA